MYSSIIIANEFLVLSFDDNDLVSPMKLLKLVYIAHGWNLAVYDKKLINEEVQAWKYGPVIRSLYDQVKEYGNTKITSLISISVDFETLESEVPRIPRDTLEGDQALGLIRKVWKAYRHFTAIQLSNMTHQPGTPWFEVYMPTKDRNVLGQEIPEKLIKEKFLELASK